MLNPSKYITLPLGFLLFAGLYLISLYSYPLFYGLGETFSVVIPICIFMMAWNSRQFFSNNYFLFLGIACLFMGGMDLLQTLAFLGGEIFPGSAADLPTQLWIASRYLSSLSFFLAPFFIGRKLSVRGTFLGYSLAVFLLLMSIFYWKNFPAANIEGLGLTAFKIISEYIVCSIFLTSIVLLLKKRKEFNRDVWQWLAAALVLIILSEFHFIYYKQTIGLFDLPGLLLEILAFYFLYRAIVETGLRRPYDLMFRDLKEKQEALEQATREMERRVQERTVELVWTNDLLRAEISEREKAEEALSQAKEGLETRVAERTRELMKANERLQGEIKDRLQAEKALQHRLTMEEFVARISARFTKISPDELDGEIYATLRAIREFMGADHSYAFLLCRDGTSIESIYETSSNGGMWQGEKIQGYSLESFPWAYEKLRTFQPILVPRVADLPPEAKAEKELWQGGSFQSMVAIPMVLGGSLLGFFGYSSGDPGKIREEELACLQMVSELLVNALERKRAEEERRKLETSILEMEKREMDTRLKVNERWAELGQMASGIAHDIRNPLNFVSLALGHLSTRTKERAGGGSKSRKLFEDAHSELMRVNRMIQDLLDYGRVRTPELEVEDASEILAKSLEEIHRLRPNEKSRLILEGIERPLLIRAERDLLLRAMLNLMENALEAGRPGETVRAGVTSRSSPARDEVIFWVQDSGKGIPVEDLDKIFTPYFSTKKSGIGMGLALVHKWTQEMKGEIQVFNFQGSGARFELSFPAVKSGASQEKPSGGR